MLFKKQTPIDAPAVPAKEPAADNPFAEIGAELVTLAESGALPEAFDLEAACSDPAFAELLQQFEPKAAVRIYAAEAQAENAYAEAMDAVMQRLNARNALPKSMRPTRAIAPTPDYMSLSPEAFRALEAQLKTAAHNGKRINL